MSADALKAEGNAAFSAGRFEEAVQKFGDAIAVDPANHVLYSNRSAAYASLNRYQEALEDAQKVTQLKGDWPKGWSRLGAANFGLRHWEEAIDAYTKGLQLDPSNEQLRQGLEDAKAAEASAARGPGGAGGLFSSPEVLSRLATDPKTRALLGQPDFMAMLSDISRNPESMQKYLADDRFQLALQVGLGFNMSMPGTSADAAAAGFEEPSPAAEPAAAAAGGRAEPMQTEEAPAGAAAAAGGASPPAAGGSERSEEEWELLNKKKEALQEKDAGNEHYKAKRFDEAITHYTRAIELYDQDVSFLSNRAAAQFEKGDYDACMADCDAAVDRGRELRADYKLIAKALTRKGNALVKQGQLEEAIRIYQKSLTEHRSADTLKRLQETDKALKEAQEKSYIDLEIATQEKDEGNAAFKDARYPEAVQHYSEALKRGPPAVNPEAYKLYSNRAACYTKLGALPEGLRDAEECIRLEPTFAKGYSRKGHLQFFMKEFDKAMETYEAGLRHDPDNQELKEGLMRCVQGINKMNRGEMTEAELKDKQARSMADPEIQGILTDPVMRQVLQEMQDDPSAAQKHMRHPEISQKIEKLISAGILQIR